MHAAHDTDLQMYLALLVLGSKAQSGSSLCHIADVPHAVPYRLQEHTLHLQSDCNPISIHSNNEGNSQYCTCYKYLLCGLPHGQQRDEI